MIYHFAEDYIRGSVSDAQLRASFLQNFSSLLLKEFSVGPHESQAIAGSVFHRMSSRSLWFHTPVHVLSSFQWCQENGIQITPLQQLAFWFHDSVFVPHAEKGRNEEASACFMRAMMSHFMERNDLFDVEVMIRATADHVDPCEKRADCNLVLDLDLCNLAWDWRAQEGVQYLLYEESFPQGSGFYKQREGYLKKLKEQMNF